MHWGKKKIQTKRRQRDRACYELITLFEVTFLAKYAMNACSDPDPGEIYRPQRIRIPSEVHAAITIAARNMNDAPSTCDGFDDRFREPN